MAARAVAQVPTTQQLLDRMDHLGMSVFTGPFNMTYFGIRGPARDQGQGDVDDLIGATYEDTQGRRHLEVWEATTDPGRSGLVDPSRVEGTGILLADRQYPRLWTFGLHRGKYRAYKQLSECAFVRDNDGDGTLDLSALLGQEVLTPERIQALNAAHLEKTKGTSQKRPDGWPLVWTGPMTMVGVNGHRASTRRDITETGPWSLLCQVVKHHRDFQRWMDLGARQQEAGWGQTFSYALLNQWDFQNPQAPSLLY